MVTGGRVIPIASAIATNGPAPSFDDGQIRFASLPPLSLYVHLPWCVRKCPYCDFNSHEARGEPDYEAYVDALIGDVESALPLIWGRTVESIFLGGGTPSLIPVEALQRLMAAMRSRLSLRPGLEVTLEANPGTVDAGRFAGYADAGVDRFSIGVQSFDSALLGRLGRIHDGDDARRAVETALRCVPRVNVDLMHALPGQSVAQAVADVRIALDLGVGHVSAYQLTLEPNTAFATTPPDDLPDADRSADIADAVEAELAAAHFEHYETSAHARPGQRCIHNLNYWRFGDYLGIGAGAHGKLSFADRIVRHARFRHPRTYLERAAGRQPALPERLFEASGTLESSNSLTAEGLPFEFALNVLRLTEGFDLGLYPAHTGRPVVELLQAIAPAIEERLLVAEAGLIRPTPLGRRHLNRVLEMLLP